MSSDKKKVEQEKVKPEVITDDLGKESQSEKPGFPEREFRKNLGCG